MHRSADDFHRILTEPEHSMIKQQQALMSTENVELIFTGGACVGRGLRRPRGPHPGTWLGLQAAHPGQHVGLDIQPMPHAAPAAAADAAIREIARVAEEVNTSVDNIGARRLHTILERILEDVSFEAPERVGCCSPLPSLPCGLLVLIAPATLMSPACLQAKESASQVNIVIDKEDVLERIGDLLKKQDLSRYVL